MQNKKYIIVGEYKSKVYNVILYVLFIRQLLPTAQQTWKLLRVREFL